MVASILESLVLGVILVVGVTMLAVVAGGYILWRRLRRRMIAFRSHGAILGATAVWDATASTRWGRHHDPVTQTDVGRWSGARARKEVWRSVDRATAAVQVADQVEAPTADLPALCRRLQAAAGDLDRVLRLDLAAPVAPTVRDQVVEVIQAAADIQGAAVASAGQANHERIVALTQDAGLELGLLDAGLDTMRNTGRPELSE